MPAMCSNRFHVARWFTQGLTLVRREIQRRDAHQRPPTYEPDLFRARFALLRRADHLSEAPHKHLGRLFDTHPLSEPLGTALQQLYQFYEADDLDGGNQALGRFADLYATGQIPEYRQIVDTIVAWGEGILAYHTTERVSNGPLKGINNLLQVLRQSPTDSPTITITQHAESS